MELDFRVSRVAFAVRLLAFTLPFVAIGAPLAADPIPITVMGGFIEIERNPIEASIGTIRLTGLGGFELRAGGSAFVPECTDCIPGVPVRLGGGVGIDDGRVTFRGVTTEFDSRSGPFADGDLFIDARTVLLPPSGPDGAFSVRTWFALDPATSALRLPDRPDPDNPDGFIPGELFQFTGRGTATLNFSRSSNGVVSYFFDTARFDFTPVPEPTSLLLLGGGLTVALLRRRRPGR